MDGVSVSVLVLVWLLLCAVWDWKTGRVPWVLSIPPLLVSGGWAMVQGRWGFLVWWALALGLWKAGLGGGDAKLLMTLTALQPQVSAVIGLLIALVLGFAVAKRLPSCRQPGRAAYRITWSLVIGWAAVMVMTATTVKGT